MGFFEIVIGDYLIPACLIILAILANGTGRRVMNTFLLPILGFEIGANGYHFKLINIILLTDFCCVLAGLSKIHKMQTLHDKVENEHTLHHVDHAFVASYNTELNHNYRNILMHICSMTLILCINVATEQYERYKPVKELGEKIDKDRKAALE